ncbi:unnamed protein product [Didymodactylos carnosus]|uniref:Uncharacterized protein n=1 Tax=Didymodactylos carnosus TaxID=1234261 RepID=A0A813Z461_9BILA|nr:unnamed protein product [Didymodactylos carnosus]CAF0892989.1 unnamed protein product [Didymodactylos carnosus]CAF3566939.1 unnamed protein product [Didymodactylos carnosus]CAF3676909.1 unnamed protein product [Didymodactylos carnosus]
MDTHEHRYNPSPATKDFDDIKEIIWPVSVGGFVALALGWMILRYACSSKEQSPHVVRCCPESLCTRIICARKRLKVTSSDEKFSNEETLRKSKLSENSSSMDIAVAYSSSLPQSQNLIEPIPASIQKEKNNSAIHIHLIPKPVRHPLRRDSLLNNDRRESLWPFKTNFNFQRQTSENIFFHT